MAEGLIQAVRNYAVGAAPLAVIGGSDFRSYTLRSVVWTRVGGGAMDLILAVLDGDKVYEIEHVVGTAALNYHWPNAATPSFMSFACPTKIRFSTTGEVAGLTQSAMLVWADQDVA